MRIDTTPTYVPTEDWRAYSGVLSRRVVAFIIDYVLVAMRYGVCRDNCNALRR